MPVSFARLRIAGFKSFAEPVSVEILPGLTGIVGPNGCGKSNVVEALRWCMGESSARSLRGAEMDDLIFAGTAGRAARNLAEVVLTLEDAAGLAPPPLHEQDELQIGRRIERGTGSAYRINGRDARARDVQCLFADLASGARSSAMVSQGRVAAIVGARPDERRSVLEEAAGITGLHARRHEAELKLRATEANLARAEDLRLQLEDQVRSLAGQAEQAARYRGVAEALRETEAALLALLHARAHRAVRSTGAARLDAARANAEADRRLAEHAEAEARLGAALHAPRENEALARALLERRRVEAERAAGDGERAREASDAAQARLAQALADCASAESRREDADREVDRLRGEQDALLAARAALPERSRNAQSVLAAAEQQLADADGAHRRDAAAAIAAGMQRAEHNRDADAANNRLARARMLLEEIEHGLADAEAALPDPSLFRFLDAALADAQRALQATEVDLDRAISARAEASRLADAARLAADDADRRRHATQAETQRRTTVVEQLERERDSLERRLAENEKGAVSEQDREAARRLLPDAETALGAATAALLDAETTRSNRAGARLDAEARRRDGARARAQAEADRSRADAAYGRAETERAQAAREHDAALAAGLPAGMLASAITARERAEAALIAINRAFDAAEADVDAAQNDAAALAETLQALRETASRLLAEADGLAQALAADADATGAAWSAVAEQLEVPDGLEPAVAAVLGDGLEAGCTETAPQRWQVLPMLPDQPLPAGAVALRTLVGAPEELGRALAGAGLIAEQTDGAALQPILGPGQCLVTRAGALWRWDGFTVAAGQPGPASIRLQQRARLRDTRTRLDEANRALPPAVGALENAQRRSGLQAARLQTLKQDRARAEQSLGNALREQNRLALADAQNRALLDALEPRLASAEAMLAEAGAARTHAAAVLSALPAQDALDLAAREAADAEAAAGRAERERREQRTRADAALQTARTRDAALATRHTAHQATRDSLLPALNRVREELAASILALDAARRALEASETVERTRMAAESAGHAEAAVAAEQGCRTARDAARTVLAQRDAERNRIADARRDGEARLAAFEARRIAAAHEHEAAIAAASRLAEAEQALPDAAALLDAARRSDAVLVEAREAERRLSQACGSLLNEDASLEAREAPLRTALADWETRLRMAGTAWEDAERRLDAAREEARARWLDPADALSRRAEIESTLLRAQEQHEADVQVLQAAEAAAAAAQERRRGSDAALAASRDALVRAEGREEQAREVLARLLADTPEPPTVVPEDLTEAAETTLRRSVAALTREREEIGPVNLRAELELAEAGARSEAIAREREEIETAIARLRGQIGQLNREGRERLLAVFEQVDRHFQSLFARMFNGGRAHLGMVGSDDPLQAGLEIYAQPPGKKLATLSLLSGGEQALTALSLVFAVFRCNPAPICVLDEVDAPLDDANVERFCALLGDMVREAGTRFLVVTHHQLTMAHMNRLYGVTMQERGVSRVLSVDLAMASSMVE